MNEKWWFVNTTLNRKPKKPVEKNCVTAGACEITTDRNVVHIVHKNFTTLSSCLPPPKNSFDYNNNLNFTLCEIEENDVQNILKNVSSKMATVPD